MPVQPVASALYEGFKTVYGFARTDYFLAIKGGGISSMGAKEVVAHGVLKQDTLSDLQGDKKGKLTQTQIHFLRGLSSMGAGFCGMVAALQQVNALVVDLTPGVLLRTGNVLFAFANVVTLYESVESLKQARESMKASDEAYRLGRLCYRSAVLGIVNSGTYLCMSAISMLGLSTSLTLILGVVAATVGGVQWFHDYWLMPKKDESQKAVEPTKNIEPILPLDASLQEKVKYSQITLTKV